MLIVGMTGGIGSGKSEALKIFQSLGVEVIDLDEISKEITTNNNKAIEEIKSAFGRNLFDKNNQLNRKKLKEIIFTDQNHKLKLENILHPKILEEVKKKLTLYYSEPYVVIDIPLLFETKEYINIISRSLVIDCELSTQVERVNKRDGVASPLLQSIINNQINRDVRLKKADDIVLNEGSKKKLFEVIQTLHKKYLNLVAVK